VGSEQSLKVRGTKSRRDLSAHTAAAETQGVNEVGPFSEAIVQMSWGNDLMLGTLRPNQWKSLEDQLERWVRDALCGDPVAEAETLTESNQVWNAQFCAVTPEIARSSGRDVGTRSGGPDFSNPRRSPRHHSPAPGRSPPGTARRSSSRPEQPSNSPKSWVPSDGDFTDFGEALMNSFNREASGHRDSRRDSAPLAYVTSFATAVADMASNLLPADSSTSRRDESPTGIMVVTVVLRRSGVDRLWGFEWEKSGFRASRVRVIENLQAGSVVEGWNRDQVGNPDRQLRPGDRLISANGKRSPDEITGELRGTEVELEFHRVVARRAPSGGTVPTRSPSPSPAPSSKMAATPAIATAPASPAKAPRRAFQAAFTDYLKVVAPGSVPFAGPSLNHTKDEQDQSQGVQSEDKDKGVDVDLDAFRDHDQVADPASRAVADLAALWAIAEGSGNDEGSAGSEGGEGSGATPLLSPRDAPYGVVAQVFSLGTGSVRLSWLFDWAAAPEDVSEQAWVERRFEIIRKQDDGSEEYRHGPCSQPLLDLELPVGHNYSFEVRAILLDTRRDHSEDDNAAELRVLWISASSSSVFADLRTVADPQPTELPEASGALPNSAVATPSSDVAVTAGGIATMADAASPAAAAAAQFVPPRRRGGVASSLGNFLAQRPNLVATSAVGAKVTPASPQPSPPSSPSRANNADGGLTDGAEEPEVDSPVRGGGTGSSESAAVVMGPFLDPLATSNPRTSAARVLDPISEKRDVAELLRLRRGGLHKEEPEVLRQRSSSFDSDDENSLMRLANALSNLERTAATKLQDTSTPAASSTAPGGEMVAQEGHHSLQVRMDSETQRTPVRPAVASSKASAAVAAAAAARDTTPQSAAAAAAAFAARGLGAEMTPVARPTQDSADDAGWASLAEEDKAKQGSGFRLVVQVSDGNAPELRWHEGGEDLETLVQQFVAEHKIKDLFTEPLVKRAAAMVRDGMREDSVDIVELIE